MASDRLATLNRRVIRVPSRPATRARVLVVSTDSMRGSQLRAILLRGHFSARLVGPDEAVATLKDGDTPNVILLDMADPTFDGLTLCRTLRSIAVGFAFVMLHPHGDLDDLLDGYEAGTDAYLVGTIDHKELFQRLDSLSWPQAISA